MIISERFFQAVKKKFGLKENEVKVLLAVTYCEFPLTRNGIHKILNKDQRDKQVALDAEITALIERCVIAKTETARPIYYITPAGLDLVNGLRQIFDELCQQINYFPA